MPAAAASTAAAAGATHQQPETDEQKHGSCSNDAATTKRQYPHNFSLSARCAGREIKHRITSRAYFVVRLRSGRAGSSNLYAVARNNNTNTPAKRYTSATATEAVHSEAKRTEAHTLVAALRA